MITRLLSFLFRNNEYSYTAHPVHVLWAILIMATGTATFIRDDWKWFGFFSFVIGLGLAVAIVLAILWDKSIKYWETINSHVELMNKIKDPSLWRALGYTPSPDRIVIEEKNYHDNGMLQIKKHYVPVPPEIMKQISNKVLFSKDLTFSEPKYGNIVPNFRKVSKQWKKDGILAQNNAKNARLGFSFTRKGMEIIYQYADETVKLQAGKERKDE